MIWVWLTGQAAWAALVGWTWEHNDRYWKHIPARLRRALLVAGAVWAPHMLLFAWLLSKMEARRLRVLRTIFVLKEMNRRRDERGAAEKCPRCGEYH